MATFLRCSFFFMVSVSLGGGRRAWGHMRVYVISYRGEVLAESSLAALLTNLSPKILTTKFLLNQPKELNSSRSWRKCFVDLSSQYFLEFKLHLSLTFRGKRKHRNLLLALGKPVMLTWRLFMSLNPSTRNSYSHIRAIEEIVTRKHLLGVKQFLDSGDEWAFILESDALLPQVHDSENAAGGGRDRWLSRTFKQTRPRFWPFTHDFKPQRGARLGKPTHGNLCPDFH